MNKNILITGSTGFVGSNLVSFIKKELDLSIVEVKRKLDKYDDEAISYDNLFSSNKTHCKFYIHLAGKAHDLKKITDESEYLEVNYELTKFFFDIFLDDNEAQTFVFMSSVKAVADVVQGELIESQSPNPNSAYGRSKLMAEKYILDNQGTDKTVIILRPCMIHGPGNKGNLNLVYRIINKGIPWPLGAYYNSRSFLSIENLCFVVKKIIEGKVPSGVYNLADDESLSTTELVSMIAELSNKNPRILNLPQSLIQVIAKAGNLLPLPLNEERLEKLTENYLVSNKKLKYALGIEMMPVSAREGMKKTIKSFE